MQLVADLHLHSKYSRAVSRQMTLLPMTQWAAFKGIDLLGTGDFTHPLWFRELQLNLVEEAEGIYRLKDQGPENKQTKFLLTAEISSIYSQGGKTRKIHNLVLAPNFKAVEKINQELLKRGANLMADGRPIVGLSARELLSLVLGADENCLLIPAHIWTPWFSLFGANSGFDSIEECFADLASHIYAIETGLSSDPSMNWAIADLKNRQIVSFSDAHSPQNLGREMTILEVPKLSYPELVKALKGDLESLAIRTIEFYPEEGKYHYTGHRQCGVVQSPQETASKGVTCPVCGKRLTVGVMHRVEQLAGKPIPEPEFKSDDFGVRWISREGRGSYTNLVPLAEIIAEVKSVGKSSKTVLNEYKTLVNNFKSELEVLTRTKPEEVTAFSGEKLAEGIAKVRKGEIFIRPGFDGEYGQVSIWQSETPQSSNEQMGLF
ncbi:MAG TPA: endonuclease Q family protein [Clostridia bacterium]|nr:endonuclease Q family protein [Clostridia bacterium]